jgi:hypothetical protein
MAFLLLMLLLALSIPLACSNGDSHSGDSVSSTGPGSGSATDTGVSGDQSGSNSGSTGTGQGTPTGGFGTAQGVDWGPTSLAAGNLEDLTIKNGVGVGFISADIGEDTEHTYAYALNIDNGTLVGSAEISGRCTLVDISTRYAFIDAGDGMRIYDLTKGFAYVLTRHDLHISSFGKYFYVEDPVWPDFLIDKDTLAHETVAHALGLNSLPEDGVYDLLYPDCLIGDPHSLEGTDSEGGRAAVYSLGQHTVIGHLPNTLLSGVRAWDPQRRLVFATSSQNDKLLAYSLDANSVIAETTVAKTEGRALGQSLEKSGLEINYSHGDRLHVIPDIQPIASGSYLVNGRDGWYALNASGEAHLMKSGVQAVGPHDASVLAYSSKRKTLESDGPDGVVVWSRDLPGFFGTHPTGPFQTVGSIAWVNSCSGLAGHGDLVSQWGYDGSVLTTTEFAGFEVAILSADPFIMALRDREQGQDGTWMIGRGDASHMPMNLVADLRVGYSPTDIHARSTEVTFTCEARNVPSEFAQDVAFEWDVDGAKLTGSQVTHTFQAAGIYTVTVSARVGNSTSVATESLEVTVRDPLVPDGFSPVVTAEVYTTTGLQFRFDSQRLSDETLTTAWDFGDGTTGTGRYLTHDYRFGDYQATCGIYDSHGTLLYDKTVQIHARYPDFNADVTPRNGYAPLTVEGSCTFSEQTYTDAGLNYNWYVADVHRATQEKQATWLEPRVRFSQSSSFTTTFTTTGTRLITLEVTGPEDVVITSSTFSVVVDPVAFTMSDQGRTLRSDVSMWADSPRDPVYDPDWDGLFQPWENAAMEQVNPTFELDEGEDWLLHQNTDRVANIVRVSPWPEGADRQTAKYVIFYYAVCWAQDYGRYVTEPIAEAHHGDVEKVILAFKIVDDQTLDLAWVYTSAHGGKNTHSGVWRARGVSRNEGVISTVLGSPWGTESMTGTLKFVDDRLYLYPSEDKHAMYISESIGESVRLVWLPVGNASGVGTIVDWFARATDHTEWCVNFVQEDVGGGPKENFLCFNAGEPSGENDHSHQTQLIDDIGWLFPNERVWSGNLIDPSCFAGGLSPSTDPDSPGKIGTNALTMPGPLEKILQADMEKG